MVEAARPSRRPRAGFFRCTSCAPCAARTKPPKAKIEDEGLDIPLLVQGEGSRMNPPAMLPNHGASILLSQSFWKA